jgi:hypothetical protein
MTWIARTGPVDGGVGTAPVGLADGAPELASLRETGALPVGEVAGPPQATTSISTRRAAGRTPTMLGRQWTVGRGTGPKGESPVKARNGPGRPPVEIAEESHRGGNDEGAHQRRVERDGDRHA